MNIANGSAALLARVRGGRRAAGPGRPGLPVPAPAGLGRRGDPRPEGGAPPARDRAPGPPAGGHPARPAARGGGRAGAARARLTATCWRRSCWPGCATCSRGPSVGHKFHAVLVVNSAHLASLGSPDTDRWLPIFWALDYFKSSQAQDVTRGQLDDGAGGRVGRPARPQGPQSVRRRRWTTGTSRRPTRPWRPWPASAGANEVYELFFRYGARDFRSIGHKAIYVANSWRTLQCIGWQHAEPVLRSLAYALLNARGRQPRPARRPGRPPLEAQPGAGGPDQGGLDRGQARHGGLGRPARARSAKAPSDDACDQVVELLNRGVAPQSIWDALFDGAGELLLRQPGIVSLHAVTSTNALHFAFQASGDDQTRRLLMLQNAAFLPMFRAAMEGRGKVADARIDQLEPVATTQAGPAAIEEIFAEASRDRMTAARKALAYLQAGHDPRPLIDAARRLVFLKGDDAHDYKFSSAVARGLLPRLARWRDRYLASSLLLLPGSGDRDNGLVKRTRAAFA